MVYELTVEKLIQGLFSLIFVIVAILIAIAIIRRYFQYKTPEHLYVGLAWIGLAGPWFSDAIVFLSILIGNFTTPSLIVADYLFITIVVSLITTYYAPIAIMFWLAAFTKLLNMEKRKLAITLFSLICFVFELLFVIFSIIDIEYIGIYTSPFTYQWSLLTTIFYLFSIVVALISGLEFSYQALKSETQENKLRGKLLIISFIFFAIGALIPYVLFNIIGLISSRLILVACVITFYFGLNMPQFVKDLILK